MTYFNFIRQATRGFGSFLAGTWLALHAVAGAAQTPPQPLFTATLSVTPAAAPPGVTRTLSIAGVWANGCIPTSARIIEPSGTAQPLVVELQRAPPSVCTLATRPFDFTLAYTPNETGVRPVVIQTDDGARGGQGEIVVSAPRAIFVLTPIISVVPDVDLPNRPRTIVIAGQTYSGCPFAPPFIDGVASITVAGIAIRLDPVQTLVPCNTNLLTPYRFELPYTPTAAGTQRVLAVSSSGGIRSESIIRTVATAGSTRAVGDISGSWYDPVTNGSGLQITHSFATTDVVFGTLYFYDSNGRPRWLTMQNNVWQSGGTVLVGDLMETKGPVLLCSPGPCPDVAAPFRFSSVAKIGTVQISFSGLGPYSDTVPQGTVEGLSLTGTTLFRMNIVRLVF